MAKLDFKSDMKVDRFNLEVEWERHTKLYLDYLEAEIEAQDTRDRLERKLELVKAEVDAKVRSRPKKYGIEKISEPAIKSAVFRSREYQDAENEYLAALKISRRLSGVMKGMEHRKRQLSNLTDLMLGGYYIGSRPSTDKLSDVRRNRQLESLKSKMSKSRRSEDD